MEKDNGLSAGSADWIKLKKNGECTKDPLTCLPSTFINIIGSQEMKVKCVKTGKACTSLPLFSE
jgi:hypothetical protein